MERRNEGSKQARKERSKEGMNEARKDRDREKKLGREISEEDKSPVLKFLNPSCSSRYSYTCHGYCD